VGLLFWEGRASGAVFRQKLHLDSFLPRLPVKAEGLCHPGLRLNRGRGGIRLLDFALWVRQRSLSLTGPARARSRRKKRERRGDEAGHLWAMDMEGFASLFAGLEAVYQEEFGPTGIVMVRGEA